MGVNKAVDSRYGVRRNGIRAALALVALCGTSAAALAQSLAKTAPPAGAATDQTGVGEIIVTAQRRSENLQKVPVAISAFTGAALAAKGIDNVADLGVVTPGLVFSSVVGYALPYLRGVGTVATGAGFENPIAIYVDGVYYAAQGGALLSLNNIEAVEVDKGPQGTLFGRNATGGAIQIRTRRPSSKLGGRISAGYGNYDTATGDLYVTGGLATNLAADLAIEYSRQGDGYGRNLSTGQEIERTRDFSARSKLLFTPSPDTEVTFSADYSKTKAVPALLPAPGTTPLGVRPAADDRRDAYGIGKSFANVRQWGVSLTISQGLSFGKVQSITAYRDTRYHSFFDNTLTDDPNVTFYIDQPEPHKQFSQELQLASDSNGRFRWVVGAYYFHERSGFGDLTSLGGGLLGLPGPIVTAPDLRTDALAGYAQATYSLNSTTRATGGFRYNYERRKIDTLTYLDDNGQREGLLSASGSRHFGSPTWRIALDHDFAPDILGYVSYNRGFKSGGFNSGVFPLAPFKPEKLDAYEVGLKTVLADRKIRLNASAFYYDYSNIQIISFPNGVLTVDNGPKARIYGLDVDGEVAVTPELRLSGGMELLHAKFGTFDQAPISVPVPGGGTQFLTGSATGNRPSRTPKLTFNVAVDYTTELSFGKVAADVTYSYNSGYFSDVDDRLRQPRYGLLNASLGLETRTSGLGLKIWGKNLTNKLYAATLAAQSPSDYIQYAAPRTYGFTVSKKF